VKVEVDQGAHAGLAILIAHLGKQRPGLPTALRRLFAQALHSIERFPRLHSLVEDEYTGVEVWEYFIKRFSLRVLYFIDGQWLVVFDILHTDRRPGAWHRRLDTF